MLGEQVDQPTRLELECRNERRVATGALWRIESRSCAQCSVGVSSTYRRVDANALGAERTDEVHLALCR